MNILEDNREIRAVNYSEEDYLLVGSKIGGKVVTALKIYGQGALHCDVPWIAVYAGDEIIKRINVNLIQSVDYC